MVLFSQPMFFLSNFFKYSESKDFAASFTRSTDHIGSYNHPMQVSSAFLSKTGSPHVQSNKVAFHKYEALFLPGTHAKNSRSSPPSIFLVTIVFFFLGVALG